MVSKKSSTTAEAPKIKKYNTFQGVFTPTVLTILGVIMYLREPWIVGNAGVLGSIGIMMLAILITGSTSLSLSSITTNIRIGKGGAFSIISQSLGLEMGGSIGIPLYFSQAFAVSMYIFGFREGWLYIFPEHEPILVDLAAFIIVFGTAFISTSLVFKLQYFVLFIIVLSLASIVGGLFKHPINEHFELFGKYPGAPETHFKGTSFWKLFAVFFPAVTGMMAGANMSGELADPRRSIPRGTLSAVLLTAVIYILLVFVAAYLANPKELVKDYYVFLDKSFFPPIVIAGLLGATISQALSSFVGAPRILQALGSYKLLPGSKIIKRTSKKGEPKNAMVLTGIIVFLALLLRNLNAIAPLITMFFMITYAMINLVVLIEQGLSLPSFRPTLKIPYIVPLFGAMGCFFVMFIINSTVSIVSMGIVIAFYIYLIKKKDLNTRIGDARSGLFSALAEWATKQSKQLSPKREKRAWQPDLYIPIESPTELRMIYRIVYSIVKPKGSVKIIGKVREDRSNEKELKKQLPEFNRNFAKERIFASHSIIQGENFGDASVISMQALEASFFKPNIVFLNVLEHDKHRDAEYKKILQRTQENHWGLCLFVPYENVGLGIEKKINLWLEDIPQNWEKLMDIGDNDLALLLSILLKRNWKAKLNILFTRSTIHGKPVQEIFRQISVLARIYGDVEVKVVGTDGIINWGNIPTADLNISGFRNTSNVDLDKLRKLKNKVQTACLFVLDSGQESVLV